MGEFIIDVIINVLILFFFAFPLYAVPKMVGQIVRENKERSNGADEDK